VHQAAQYIENWKNQTGFDLRVARQAQVLQVLLSSNVDLDEIVKRVKVEFDAAIIARLLTGHTEEM